MTQARAYLSLDRSTLDWLRSVAAYMVEYEEGDSPSSAQLLASYLDGALMDVSMDIDKPRPSRPTVFATHVGNDPIKCGIPTSRMNMADLAHAAMAWGVSKSVALRTLLLAKAEADAFLLPPDARAPTFTVQLAFSGPADLMAALRRASVTGLVDITLFGLVDRFALLRDGLERSFHAARRAVWLTKAVDHLAKVDAFGAPYGTNSITITTRVPCGWLARAMVEDVTPCPPLTGSDLARAALLDAVRRGTLS